MPSCQAEWCSLKQVAHQVVTFAAHSLELILPLKIVKKQSDSQVTIDITVSNRATLILIKRYVMVELFIFGKNGHQVMWCNLVSIFVICADRIPGVLAILRSKGHQESGGVTKSVHRWYIQLLYLTSKSSSSGVIAALKSQNVSRT